MKARCAFEICHEIYVAARALVDERLSTTQLASSGKFLWRPDLHPRLVEYVADFALAGERALGETCTEPCQLLAGRGRRQPVGLRASNKSASHRHAPQAFQFVSAPPVPRASRLILFRMYFLGGAEYHAARNTLGISERTWADWADEIRNLVGRELLRRGMFPPARYFREMSGRS
jgi:hypothetical protein